MKALIITLIPSPHIYQIHREFAEHPGVELEIIYELQSSPKRNWGEYIPPCKYTILNSIKLLGVSSLLDFKLKKILKTKQPDVLIIGTSPWSFNTWIIQNWAVKNFIPYLVFSEPPDNNRTYLNKIIKKSISRKLLNNAIAYLGVTKKTCDLISTAYQIKLPTFVLPYYSNLESFFSVCRKDDKNSPTRLLFLGELTSNKRVDLILEALQGVENDYRLNIVGDGPLSSELKEKSKVLPRNHVLFHGKVPYDQIHDILSSNDYLILPSAYDGFGMVVIEALASGVPVIASDNVMSAVEFINDGINGWIFNNDCVDQLKKLIEIATSTNDNWSKMSKNARDSLVNYDAKKIAHSLYDFLKSLITK